MIVNSTTQKHKNKERQPTSVALLALFGGADKGTQKMKINNFNKNHMKAVLLAFKKVNEEELGHMMDIALNEGVENNKDGLYRHEREGHFTGESLLAKYGDIVRSRVQRLMKVTAKRYKSIIDALIEDERRVGKTRAAANRNIVMVRRLDFDVPTLSAIDGATRLEAVLYSFKSGYRWNELSNIPFTVSTYDAGSDMAEMILFKYLNCAKPISAKDNGVASKIASGRYVLALLCRDMDEDKRKEFAKLMDMENRAQATTDLETIVSSEFIAAKLANPKDSLFKSSIKNMDDFKDVLPYNFEDSLVLDTTFSCISRAINILESAPWLFNNTPWVEGDSKRSSKKARQIALVGSALTMANISTDSFLVALSKPEGTHRLRMMMSQKSKSLSPARDGKDLDAYLKQQRAYARVFKKFMMEGDTNYAV